MLAALSLAAPFSLLAQTSTPAQEPIVHELEAYSVVATKTPRRILDVAGSVSVISSTDIDDLGVFDANDLLRFEPLVILPFDLGGSDAFVPYQSAGYSAYNIRGLGGNRVLALVDGIRQPEQISLNGGARGDTFDPAVFESLEILKGSGSSLYGSDALAGVVALQTRDPAQLIEPGRTRRVELGANYDTASETLSLRGSYAQRFANGATASILGVYRDGSERENNGTTPANPEELTSTHLLARTHWDVTERQSWLVIAESFRREQAIEVDSTEGSFPLTGLVVEEVTYTSEQSRDRLTVEHDFHGGPASVYDTWTNRFYWQESASETVNTQLANTFFGSPGRDRTDTIDYAHRILGWQSLATAEYSTPFGLARSTFGLELSLTTASNDFLRTDRVPVEAVDDLVAMPPSDTTRAAFFVQTEMTKGKWQFIPGLRLEYYAIDPTNSEAYVNNLTERLPEDQRDLRAAEYDLFSYAPSIAVLYEATDRLNVYARYAHGFRTPTAEEFNGLFFHSSQFAQIPNPELTEERSIAGEIGIKGFFDYFEFQVAIFGTRFNDFFEQVLTDEKLDPNDPVSLDIQQIRNVGSVDIYGYEVSTITNLVGFAERLEGWSLVLNFGHAIGEDRTNHTWLASTAPFTAIGALTYRDASGDFGLDLSATHRAEKSRIPPAGLGGQTPFIPAASTVFDLTGFYTLPESWLGADRGQLRLTFGVKNLTDEKYNTWANTNAGIHFPDDPERSTLPGINGYAGVTWVW